MQGYGYDSARRLQTVTSLSGSYTYSYISAGGSTASRLVRGISIPTTAPSSLITNVFDSTGHLKATTLVTGATVHNNHAYNVNVAHDRTKRTRLDGSYVDYTYDNAEQIYTALSFTSGGSPISTEQLKYGYDAGLNLVKRTNNLTVATYAVNSLNQVTSGDGSSYGYDSNGNRTSKDHTTYTYDDENQLIAAYQESPSVPFASYRRTDLSYDARGRLRKRVEYSAHNGTSYTSTVETRYLYNGMRVVQERNSSNVPLSSYTRSLDLSGTFEGAGGIGGLLARKAHTGANGVTLRHAFYHADGNGNLTYLINPDKTLGASYVYDPYGRTLSSSGTLAAANTYLVSLLVFGGRG